jgi:hypothetical protein
VLGAGLVVGGLRVVERAQGGVPVRFEGAGDEPVGGVDGQVAAAGQVGVVAGALGVGAAARIRRIVPAPDTVAEAEQLALDAPVPHRRFCLARCRTRSRISSGTGGRPPVFGQVHLFLIRRRCQASKVHGVTIRCRRMCPGSSPASAAIRARSAQSGFGRAT